MRKPVAVAAIVIMLLLLITLARRLAQPAIGEDPANLSAPSAMAAENSPPSSVPASSLPPPPSRPMLSSPSSVDVASAEAPARKQAVERSHLRRGNPIRRHSADAQRQTELTQFTDQPADHPVSKPSSYRALLGEPSSRIRRVVDHGAHGIGTPQWIEPLSGPKTRVPVRDFSTEKSLKSDVSVAPLAVPVSSDPQNVANSAH